MTNLKFLKASGSKIVDESGCELRLRGFSFAGWLNFENFMIGMPGHESGVRRSMAQVMGKEKAGCFFDSFLNHFVTEEDFGFMQSLGCNLVRIPFNYRHFESDDKPFEYKPEGFMWLDKAIEWGRQYGVYLILDMHAGQGGQNGHFFTDIISGHAGLWDQKVFANRVVALWQEIARRYCDEPVIAGYDLLNEPIPDDITQLSAIYHRIIGAIRNVDKRHMVVIEGDGYSTRFSGLDFPFDSNALYTNHFYSNCGMEVMEYPGVWSWDGKYYDREVLKRDYIERTAYMREHNVPNWLGETSVTFPHGVSEASRMRFLEDMLSIAEQQGDSWGFGIYKDLGRTGIVYADPESEWAKRSAPVRRAIGELRCNPFADTTKSRIDDLCSEMGQYAKGVIGELDEALSAETLANKIKFSVCESVLPLLLQAPFARQFAEMTVEEIDLMMESFSLKNCRQRTGWVDVVKKVNGVA